MSRAKPSISSAHLQITPWRLFIYAQAFRFSSGHGKCFSPGVKALLIWYAQRFKQVLLNRKLARQWRMYFERH